jgi:hypothetical protein
MSKNKGPKTQISSNLRYVAIFVTVCQSQSLQRCDPARSDEMV